MKLGTQEQIDSAMAAARLLWSIAGHESQHMSADKPGSPYRAADLVFCTTAPLAWPDMPLDLLRNALAEHGPEDLPYFVAKRREDRASEADSCEECGRHGDDRWWYLI